MNDNSPSWRHWLQRLRVSRSDVMQFVVIATCQLYFATLNVAVNLVDVHAHILDTGQYKRLKQIILGRVVQTELYGTVDLAIVNQRFLLVDVIRLLDEQSLRVSDLRLGWRFAVELLGRQALDATYGEEGVSSLETEFLLGVLVVFGVGGFGEAVEGVAPRLEEHRVRAVLAHVAVVLALEARQRALPGEAA